MGRSLKVNRKKAKEALEKSSGQGMESTTLNIPAGMEIFKPESAGKYSLDFLLYEVNTDKHPDVDAGELFYNRKYYIHKDIGPEGSWVVCPKKTLKKPCPICEEVSKMKKDPKMDEDVLKALYPKERELYVVIDTEDKEEKIQLFDQSSYLFGKDFFETINESEDDDLLGFADLQDGQTVTIKFKKKTHDTFTYYEPVDFEFSKRDDYDEDILDEVPDLDACLKIESYDYLKELFEGGSAGDDEDDEEQEDESPRSRRKRGDKKSKRKSKDEDDEQEEDEDDSSEALEIPDGHSVCVACQGSGKNSRGRTCRICDGVGYCEDPEEDEDEDDEDDDPAPSKSKKKKVRRRNRG